MTSVHKEIARFVMNKSDFAEDTAIRLVASGGDSQDVAFALEDVLQAFCEQHGITDEVLSIAHERKGQTEREGWTPGHDDRQHVSGGLAQAAAAYALSAAGNEMSRAVWPCDPDWYKPKTPERDLERAGALIVAEMQRRRRQEGGAT